MPFHVYMLKCSDGSYYVGHTDAIEQRIALHQTGKIEGYTSTRLPIEVVWMQNFHERDAAFIMERKLKGWSRKKKEALIQGDWKLISELSKNYKEKGDPSTSSG